MKKFVKAILNFFICHVLYRVEYINKENEEKLESCVICPNHSSTIEAFYIWSKTDELNTMAKAEHFNNKLKATVLKWLGIFPVRRGEKDVASMLHAIRVLKNYKQKLLIFPEGTRVTNDFRRSIAHTGPLYIAAKAGVPVVPVFITRLPKKFSKVKVIYGKPLYISEKICNDKNKLKEIAENMVNDIYMMGNINRKEMLKKDSKNRKGV